MRLLVLLSVFMVVSPLPMEAGVLNRLLRGRTASRVLNRGSRAAERSVDRDLSRMLARDRTRDARGAASRLNRARTVQRYTTREQAQSYLKRGIPSGTHFTTKASPGPPLTSGRATSRYGLPSQPDVRIRVELPRGTAVKSGKVVGGHPGGYGETKTYRSPLPPSAVKSVAPVRLSPRASR
jgi:hypothetical protein